MATIEKSGGNKRWQRRGEMGTPPHTHTSLVAVKNGAAWPFLGSPHDPVIPLLRMRRGETKANVHPQTCPGRAKQQHSL